MEQHPTEWAEIQDWCPLSKILIQEAAPAIGCNHLDSSCFETTLLGWVVVNPPPKRQDHGCCTIPGRSGSCLSGRPVILDDSLLVLSLLVAIGALVDDPGYLANSCHLQDINLHTNDIKHSGKLQGHSFSIFGLITSGPSTSVGRSRHVVGCTQCDGRPLFLLFFLCF